MTSAQTLERKISAELFIHANIICKFRVMPYYNIRLSEHLLASVVITQSNSIKAIFINAWKFRVTDEIIAWVNQYELNNEGTIFFYQDDRFLRLNRVGDITEIAEVQHEEILILFEANLSREDLYVYDICDSALGMVYDFTGKILELKNKSKDTIEYLRDNLYSQRLVMKGTNEFHCNYSWKQAFRKGELKSGNKNSNQGDFGMNFSVDFIPLKGQQISEEPNFPLLTIKLTAEGNWCEAGQADMNLASTSNDVMCITYSLSYDHFHNFREAFENNKDKLNLVLNGIMKRIEQKQESAEGDCVFNLQLD